MSVFLIYRGSCGIKEEFENSSAQNMLESIYRPLTDIVCPALIKAREKLAEDPDNGNVDEFIRDNADGDVILCPALTKDTLYFMDPNIGDQMVRTIRFLEEKMSDILDKINDNLNKSCEEAKDYAEGFESAPPVKAEEAEALKNFKELIYGQRIASLYAAVNSNADIAAKLSRVNYLYIQLTEIEKNPDKLKGSC